MPVAPFRTLNYNHYAALQSLSDICIIVPNDAEDNQLIDIMDVIVGRKRFHPDQSKILHRCHIDTPQDKNDNKDHLQG